MLGRRPSSPYSSKVVHNQHCQSSCFGYSLKQLAIYSIWVAAVLASTTTSLLLIAYQHDINNIAHWWSTSCRGQQPYQQQTQENTNAPALPSSLIRRAQEKVLSLQSDRAEVSEEQKQQDILPTTLAPPAAAAARSPIQFQWHCSGQCSCLPPVRDDIVYMHQSYNVKNQTYWPKSWATFRQSWLDHHANDGWVFVFWLDKHNDLLARCSGYDALFQGRSFIQKADLSRLLYLHRYAGFYADMDYLALKSQVPLLKEHPSTAQKCANFVTGSCRSSCWTGMGLCSLATAATTRVLDVLLGQSHWASVSAFISTGPHMLKRCLKRYIISNEQQGTGTLSSMPHMHAFHNNSIAIVEPRLIAPVDGRDFNSNCAAWRGRNDAAWQGTRSGGEWQTSSCRHELVDERDAFAVTFNTQSWKRTTRLQEYNADE